jgi:hypothetical protein
MFDTRVVPFADVLGGKAPLIVEPPQPEPARFAGYTFRQRRPSAWFRLRERETRLYWPERGSPIIWPPPMEYVPRNPVVPPPGHPYDVEILPEMQIGWDPADGSDTNVFWSNTLGEAAPLSLETLRAAWREVFPPLPGCVPPGTVVVEDPMAPAGMIHYSHVHDPNEWPAHQQFDWRQISVPFTLSVEQLRVLYPDVEPDDAVRRLERAANAPLPWPQPGAFVDLLMGPRVQLRDDDESAVEPATIEALMDLARAGNREDFLWLAGSAGVAPEKHEELWAGTRRRLGLTT